MLHRDTHKMAHLDGDPKNTTEMDSFRSSQSDSIIFDKLWTEEDERKLQEDYNQKDHQAKKGQYLGGVQYVWHTVKEETSHPEADYVWTVAYKLFGQSPYELFPMNRTGSTLELADKGICQLFAQVLALPGIEGDIEFLHYILQYAAHFICNKAPKPEEYSGKLPPKHLYFMKILMQDDNTENSIETENRSHVESKSMATCHYRSALDPFVVDDNAIANRQILWTIITAWILYSEQEDLPTLADYEYDLRQRLSLEQEENGVNIIQLKEAWPLQHRRNVIRAHQCRYSDVYRNIKIHTKEIVEFIENSTPEPYKKDLNDNNPFYSVNAIIESIPKWQDYRTPSMTALNQHIATIRGREWHCFSHSRGMHNQPRAGDVRYLTFIPLYMKKGLLQSVTNIGGHKVWVKGLDKVYLDGDGEYVDMKNGGEDERGWFIGKGDSEVESGCGNCGRAVCCQVRRRWNGVVVRTVLQYRNPNRS